jgi:hypothetical protein
MNPELSDSKVVQGPFLHGLNLRGSQIAVLPWYLSAYFDEGYSGRKHPLPAPEIALFLNVKEESQGRGRLGLAMRQT